MNVVSVALALAGIALGCLVLRRASPVLRQSRSGAWENATPWAVIRFTLLTCLWLAAGGGLLWAAHSVDPLLGRAVALGLLAVAAIRMRAKGT